MIYNWQFIGRNKCLHKVFVHFVSMIAIKCVLFYQAVEIAIVMHGHKTTENHNEC